MKTTTLSNEFGSRLGVDNIVEIPRLRHISLEEFKKTYFPTGTPVILEGQLDNWQAIKLWNPQFFKELYSDVVSDVVVNTPEVGSFGNLKAKDYTHSIPIGEMITKMENPECNYRMGDLPIHRLPGIEKYLDFNDFLPHQDIPTIISLWFGGPSSRCNLHWDAYDNYLAQVYGSKFVIMYAPQDTKYLYPFDGYVRVSRIDPFNPNLDAYPQYRRAKVMIAKLDPGDLLFFGKGWWHQVRNEELTIGVNCFFGNMAPTCYLKAATRCGLRQWTTIMRDFFSLGVLGREPEGFFRTGDPTGRFLYSLLTGPIKRRLPWRQRDTQNIKPY